MSKVRVSIGVFAYNEENTIAQTLTGLLEQVCTSVEILEIVVVSSACTDRTDDIVAAIACRRPMVRHLREPLRRGKASSVNRYLENRNPAADFCVLVSADLLPAPDTLDNLLAAFSDERIGMAGGRPVPVNPPTDFLGFAVHLQWQLHHTIAMSHPKCGELVALRSVWVQSIPEESPVDEASLEALCVSKGYRLGYAPEARFFNRGPGSMAEFIAQRRRIASGHRWLRRTAGYSVATASPWVVLKTLARQIRWRPREIVWIAGTVLLEAYSRVLGTFDATFRPRVHQAWKTIPSTKQTFAETSPLGEP